MKFNRRQLRTLIESLVLENTKEFESANYEYFSKAAELVQRLKEVQKDLSEKARKVAEQQRVIGRAKYSSGYDGLVGTAALGTGAPQSELRAREELVREASKKFDIAFKELEDLGEQMFFRNTEGEHMDDLAYGAGFSEEDLQVFEGIGWHKKSSEVRSELDANPDYKGRGFYAIKEDLRRYNYPDYLQTDNSNSAYYILGVLEDFIQRMLVPVQ